MKKSDDSLCLVTNYCRLHECFDASIYPLPRIDEILHVVGVSQYFSKIDAVSVFNQIAIRSQDRHILAFITEEAAYQYKVSPFVIKTVPSAFQRAMDATLGNLKWTHALVFVDDIIVFSATFEDQLKKLDKVLERLENARWTINSKKSEFVFHD